MKKLNWKFILPPPMLALFLFAACNLIQEMPQDFVETYGNIAYVEKVEYVNLAEENVGTPKVTETKNFKIIYHIKNDGDFDLSPEFSFEGCEIENPIVSTEKKRVTLTVAGESLKTLKDGAEFKVRLTLYKATQKVLQSAYEIDMRYVYTGGPDVPKGTVEIKIPLNLPDGYTLEVKDSTDFKCEKDENGSWIVTTIGSGVAEDNYELELVVKDEKRNVIGEVKKTIEVSAEKPTTDFAKKDDEKSITDFIEEVKKEIEKNPPREPDTPDESKGLVKIEISPLPEGYMLEINDNDNFNIKQNEDGSYTIVTKDKGGLPKGNYELELIVKDTESGEKISIKKKIDVSAGQPTGGFTGEPDDKPFEITEDVIAESRKNIVYVRGSDAPWYASHPEAAEASDDDNSGSLLSPFATIQRAINEVITRNAASADASAYTICVDGTFTQNAAANANGMADFSALDKNLTLTIKSRSKTQKATLNANQKSSIIRAVPGTNGVLNLTLENLVIMGGKALNGGGVYFSSSGGKLTIGDGTEIISNTATNSGGGIYVNAGTFTMAGGTISDNEANYGSGVYVNGGTLTIKGGTISGNTASQDGGGVYITGSASEFTMSGGKISDENTAQNGGGVYVADSSTFTMTAGEISSNKAIVGNANFPGQGGGVYVNSAEFKISGEAKIRKNTAAVSGGGIYIYKKPMASSATLTMAGGEISENIATEKGGAIYVNDGTYEMIDGVLNKNKATNNGGGVYVQGGKFTISGGTISSNEATFGGGICVYKEDYNISAKLEMKGGEISGNEAFASGGGVQVQKGIFEMNNGIISGNKAKYGKGVVVALSGTLDMSNEARIKEDNDVYLFDNKQINIAGDFNNSVSILVAMITPSDYTADRQVLSADDERTMQDNYDKFAVTPDNGTNWKIVPYESDKKFGVLKQDNVSTGGGGISVTLPEFGETYTIVIESNGNPIVKNSEIISGNDIILVSVTDPKGTSVNGTVTIELKDESGTNILKSNDSNSKTLHVPKYTFEMQAQVYVKVELSNPIRVIPETIPVTIKPNS